MSDFVRRRVRSFCLRLIVLLVVLASASASAAPRIADGFQYPVGGSTPGSVTAEQDDIDDFFNALDFAANGTGTNADALHGGEDWRRNEDSANPAAEVRAVAAGDIVAISEADRLVLVRHHVPAGTLPGAAPSPRLAGAEELYSVYRNVIPEFSDFNSQTSVFSVPIPVERGALVGVIDTDSEPQIHFELRTIEPSFDSIFDNAVDPEGFYASQSALDAEGLIDPSDFIDEHRTIELVQGPQLYIHDDGETIALVDVLTGDLEGLTDLGQTLTDIAFSPSGQLFGMDFGMLYRINLVTGELTELGFHGVPGGNALVFSATGELYAAGNGTTQLFLVDPQTGSSTAVGDTGIMSSGDLAFFEGELFLSGFESLGSSSDVLMRLQLAPTFSASVVGDIGFNSVFGLATAADGQLYGTSRTEVLLIDPTTGAGTPIIDYAGQGLDASNGSSFFVEAGAPSTLLATSVLPTSRSVAIGDTATAFVSVINAGTDTASNCVIAPRSNLNGTFEFQATDPATNAPTGVRNAPVDIPASGVASFIVFLQSAQQRESDEFVFNVGCENTELASPTAGLNTLLFSASATPAPDVVALVATPTNDGVISIDLSSGVGAFALASFNVGAGDEMSVTLDTGAANALPLQINLCETDTAGQCISGAPSSSVVTSIANGGTPTFSIFVASAEGIDFRPELNRVFIRFRDSTGVIRGSTSVAIRAE